MILPQVSREIVETGDIQKRLVGRLDATPEGLREDTKVLEVSNGMLDSDPDRRKSSIGFLGDWREIRPMRFLDRGHESRPWGNGFCSLISGISQNDAVGRDPGENCVIFHEPLVMTLPLHGLGNSQDTSGGGMDDELVLDGMPFLLAGVEVRLILGVFGSTDRPLGGIHDAGGESRTHLQESMQGVDSALGQGQLPSQGSNQDALQELLPGEDVPLV